MQQGYHGGSTQFALTSQYVLKINWKDNYLESGALSMQVSIFLDSSIKDAQTLLENISGVCPLDYEFNFS